MKRIRKEWKHLRTLKWWQVLDQFFIFITFAGMIFSGVVFIFGLGEEYAKIAFLMLFSGLGAVFAIFLIFTPFITKKPFIPDDIADPILRREKFESDLGMYGLSILFFVAIYWIIVVTLKGGVESDWIFFFGILWVGSALFMWSPPVRERIDRYYERNTLEMTDGA